MHGRISANGQKVLDCKFLITWIQSPLLLTVGVLRIAGHHPDTPERRIVAHLIDARRGSSEANVSKSLGPLGVRIGMTELKFLTAVAQAPVVRYRLHHPDGKESVDLVGVDMDKPWGRFFGVFRHGVLNYGAHGSWVASYLKHRGYELQYGPFQAKNRVPVDSSR
ncbi:MAG: hypothetical protein ACI89X_001441 [Planctomycetota bacterium]|jgi:hypothetical protein